MNKKFTKALTAVAALTVGITAVFGLGACTYHRKALEGDISGSVSSQGGWVVKKGNYVYFINGQPDENTDEDGNVTYENTFGDVVKGSLCRVKVGSNGKIDYASSETVVPLIVTGQNYNSGIFIYGDYVYYATPTTTKNIQGGEESGYLDFKRSKLDGSETMSGYYFRSSDATADYRFVEVNGTVYCLHVDGSSLYSYKINGEKGEDTLLVKDAASYQFDSYDAANPYVYYTMSVTADIDRKNPVTQSYNQVYRVRADASYAWDSTGKYTVTGYTDDYTDGTAATESETYQYTYTFDYQSLADLAEENDTDFSKNEIEDYPYVNLGQVVLDGIGTGNVKTQFNRGTANGDTPDGYTYTLNTYANGGLYYTKAYNQTTSASGDVGRMYYIADETAAVNSDPVANNGEGYNDIIGLEQSNASSAGYFYQDENGHHYFYVNGSTLVRVDLDEEGNETETSVARNVSVAEYLGMDAGNVYYTAGSDSIGVYRTEYTADKDFNGFVDSENRTVNLFGAAHVSGWYKPEIIDGNLFYLDSLTVGTVDYSYVRTVSFRNDDGSIMDNEEIAAVNEKIEEVTKIYNTVSENLSSAYTVIDYFRRTDGGIVSTKYTMETAKDYSGDGIIDLYDEVIQYSVENGNTESKIFAPEVQKCVTAYLKGEAYVYSKTVTIDFTGFKEGGEYAEFKNYGDFYHQIGIQDDDKDALEALSDEWRISVLGGEAYDNSLPAWAWALIWVAVGVGAVGIICAVTIPLLVHFRKKKQTAAPVARKKVKVDMDVDENLDVYATEEEPQTTTEEGVEETAGNGGEEATQTEVSAGAEVGDEKEGTKE